MTTIQAKEDRTIGRARLAALVREPLVHFLVIGAALLLFFEWSGGAGGPERRRIVIGSVSPMVVSGLAVGFGLLHGWQNGAGLAQALREALGPVGITGAIFTLFALVATCVVSLRVPWTRIVVRVAGSWIAAIGLLMLGWALRGSV